MVSKARVLVAILMLTLMNLAHAETQKTVTFENQREEIFDLENFLKETKYKTETVDSTCYNQVPYTENVCRDVTHYREACHTEPAHQECGTVYDRVCRTENRYENECHMERGEQSCRVVVRYRQECSTEDGGRQCHTVPGDVQCSIINGENRCVKIPPHEECSNGPGRQVCRQVPYEERECSEGPSRQVCEQVNRPHQVCENVSRYECSTVPAERVCENVPYSVNECKDEVLYRQVPYACKKEVQVPYEVLLKTHQANVQILFNSQSNDAASEFTVNLNNKGELSIEGSELEGNKAMAFAKKDVKGESHGDINTIKGVFNVSLLNKADLFQVSSKGITNVDLGKRSLSFVVNGKYDHKNASLSVKIAKKDDVKFEKVLKANQFTSKFDGSVTRVEVDLESLGAPKLGGLFNKNHTVTLKLKMDYAALGQLVLPKTGELSVGTSVEVKAD